MAEEPTAPSETVKRLREIFARLAAELTPEDEPAIVYCPAVHHSEPADE